MFGVTFDDPEVEDRIRVGAEAVEEMLAHRSASDDPFVTEAAAHLMRAGGKRFRPLLVLLCAEFGDPTRPEVIKAAAAVELTHVATLYHDDVMDEADMRRGQPSANARWTNSLAILVGDFLLAEASALVSELGPEAVRIQAETFSRLVHGQIRETLGPREGQDLLDHYRDVVGGKTGSLIATSARYGSLLSGASSDVVDTLTEYGERIGVAFQLADDILDVASETDDSGKTPGTDLREGVPTLPTLFAMRSTDPADADLVEALQGPITDEDVVADVLARLRKHPAMDEARAYVQAEADTARALVERLPAGPARAALATLCDSVATRLA